MDTKKLNKLLVHFKTHGVSHDPKRGDKVLEFQDIIGRSTAGDIVEAYINMNLNTRQLFMWVSFLTLSMDVALNLVRICVVYPSREKLIEPYQKEISSISIECMNLKNEIKAQKDEIEKQKDEIDALNKTIGEYRYKIQAAQIDTIKANKYDKIKEALTD